MSGRMSAWLEPPRPAEPGRPRRGRGLGALASQADDDPVPLVQVAAQYLDVLVVADPGLHLDAPERAVRREDRKSTRLNSSHDQISYAVFCLKKKKKNTKHFTR